MRGRLLASTGGFALVLALSVLGCPAGDERVAGTSDAGSGIPSGDAARAGADAPLDEPEPIPPEGLPPGWVRWDGGGKMCKFYVPASPENLPKALHWVDCPVGGDIPAGATCRQIAVDWDSPFGQSGLWFLVRRTLGGDGLPRFAIGRHVDGFVRREIIAEDGRVEHAILAGNKSACGFALGDFRKGRYAYAFRGTEGGGILSGRIEEPRPDQVLRWTVSDPPHDPFVTPFGVMDLWIGHTLTLYPGGNEPDAGVRIWSAARDDGLQQGPVSSTDDAVFWQASNGAYGKQRVYTTEGGVRAVRDFGTDWTRRDFDLGSDGRDLARIYGSERARPSGPFPRLELMTAPYTTNPANLAPRSLGSYQGSAGAQPMQVGCGHAIHNGIVASTLLRLSDGRRWRLPATGPATGLALGEPIGVSCEEVFFIASLPSANGPVRTLVRVRIDSLGPGTPAD